MPLSWNEIRNRALAFSQEYKNATRENAESQSFYNGFFNWNRADAGAPSHHRPKHDLTN